MISDKHPHEHERLQSGAHASTSGDAEATDNTSSQKGSAHQAASTGSKHQKGNSPRAGERQSGNSKRQSLKAGIGTEGTGSRQEGRGVYSFCMCPGGQIVPTTTNPDELCINGMSFRYSVILLCIALDGLYCRQWLQQLHCACTLDRIGYVQGESAIFMPIWGSFVQFL